MNETFEYDGETIQITLDERNGFEIYQWLEVSEEILLEWDEKGVHFMTR